MRIEQTYVQRSKAFLHAAQTLVTFIAACLALGVLTKKGDVGKEVGFYFALCFFSIPALIYQVMVPMWTRARRFANIYAYLALDLLFALLWFSAFIAVAVWEARGVKEGSSDTDDKNGNGTCAKFAYGSKSKCEVSKASAGMGALLFVLWSLTSAVSVYMVIRYRKTGIAPGATHVNGRRPSNFPQSDDDAKGTWSTKIDEHAPDDTSDDERRRYGQTDDDEEGLLHDAARPASRDTQTEHGAHPGRPLSYGSPVHSRVSTPQYDESLAPSALSPTDYGRQSAINPFAPPASSPQLQASSGRVQFPSGNY